MQQIIKLSTDGSNQVLRLPKEFRFEGDEVEIRRDSHTGAVILSQPAKSLSRFFEIVGELTQEERDAFVLPTRDRSPMRIPDLSE